jgi:hypothetical protein
MRVCINGHWGTVVHTTAEFVFVRFDGVYLPVPIDPSQITG